MSDMTAYAGAWSVDDTSAICPTCLDSGIKGFYYEQGDPRLVRYLACDCLSATKQRNQTSGDLAQFPDKTFATLDHLPAVTALIQRCADYAANPQGWLVLSGGYGSGKTHCATAIGHAAIARGLSAQFFVLPELLDALRATFSDKAGESFETRWQRIRGASLLILDDIGTENLTDWAQEKRYQLVNYRYNLALPTVFTTNVPLLRLAVTDGRIESRMSDTALVEHLDFVGVADYRKLNRQQRKAA